jgi:uncharacterized membrane protein
VLSFIVAFLSIGLLQFFIQSSFECDNIFIILSIIVGILYYYVIFSYLKSLTDGPVIINWTLLKMSMVIPVLFSIFFLKEYPAFYKIIGIVFIFISFVFFDLARKGNK